MRRTLLAGIAALLVPARARAQPGKVFRVIQVNTASSERKAGLQAFLEGMRDLGYVHGRNLEFAEIVSRRDASDLGTKVDEAIARRPDVFIAWESIAQVIHRKTRSIPIVLVGALDPVKAGLAHSLASPGLNVTGFAQLNDQLPGKHMEILREFLPRLKRVGQLVDRSASGCRVAEAHSIRAAQSLGCVLVPYYVSNEAEIRRAFDEMGRDLPDALLPCPSTVLYSFRDVLFENVLRLRIPLTSYIVNNVPHGVLFAHAASHADLYRRAAVIVDKILRGANAGELPIEQPTTFQLVVNLGTAQALGLTVPQSILLRADRVIE
jgi:putative tryptophan/tyrosine transport system substrate-binding protein